MSVNNRLVGLVREALQGLHMTLMDAHAASVLNSFTILEGLRSVLLEQVLPEEEVPLSGFTARDVTLELIIDMLFLPQDAAAQQQPQTADRPRTATILQFIEQSLSPERVSQNNVPAKAVKEALSLCVDCVTRVGPLMTRQNLVAIRRGCVDAFVLLFRVKSLQAVQAEALSLILAVIRRGKRVLHAADVDPRNILGLATRVCQGAASSTGQTVRAVALQLIGALADEYPSQLGPEAKSMLQHFLNALESQAQREEPEVTLSEGLLKGFSDYLNQFSSTVDEGAAYLSTLYRFLLATFLLAAEAASRYAMAHAALEMLQRHARLFKEHLVATALETSEVLSKLCGHKNVPLHKRAFPAAGAFLQTLSLELCTGTRHSKERATQVLGSLLVHLKKHMASNGRYEVSYAITAYGLFARPLAFYVGKQALQTLMSEVMFQCEAIFSRGQDEVEEATTHLSQYLNTYACFLLEDVELLPSHVESINSLLHTVLVMYPMPFHFPKLRLMTAPAVLRLLCATARHEATHGVLASFVQRALLLTGASSDVFGEGKDLGERQPPRQQLTAANRNNEDDEPFFPQQRPATDDGALYDEYVPLWKVLLTKPGPEVLARWGFPWTDARGLTSDTVAEITNSVRSTLLNSIVDFMLPLDLKCSTVELARTGGAADVRPAPTPLGTINAHEAHQGAIAISGDAIAPANPKDFNMFLNLVQFFDAVAATLLLPDDAVTWGTQLTEPLIRMGTAYPHVSGFYSMLASLAAQLTLVPAFKPVTETSDSTTTAFSPQLSAVRELLARYVTTAHARLADYSHELRVACLRFLLTCPLGHVVTLEQSVVPIATSLQVGLVHEPAALLAFDRLLEWLEASPRRAPPVLLPAALPLVKKYAAAVATEPTRSVGRWERCKWRLADSGRKAVGIGR
jgi:hypothetical protein